MKWADTVTKAGLVAAALLVLVGAACVVLADKRTSVEFSTDKFCHRERTDYVLSRLGWRVWPTQTREFRSRLDEYLLGRGFVAEQPGPGASAEWRCLVTRWEPCTWDRLLRERRRANEDHCGYYSGHWLNPDTSKDWVAWSEKHPAIARVGWAAAAGAVRARNPKAPNPYLGSTYCLMLSVRAAETPAHAVEHCSSFSPHLVPKHVIETLRRQVKATPPATTAPAKLGSASEVNHD